MAKVFGIASFEDDNSVAVISKAWMCENNLEIYYPPSGTKSIKKLVKKNLAPGDSWPKYKVKILKWFETYEAAHTKLNDATLTSDLSGAEIGKRRSIPTSLPSFPTHPALVMDSEILASSNAVNTPLDNNVEQEVAVPLSDTNQNPEIIYYQPVDDNNFQAEVLRRLESMSLTLQEHGRSLAAITEQIAAQLSSVRVPLTYEFEVGTFPCKNIESLRNLELLLTRDAWARKKMVEILRGCGGGTIEDAVDLMFNKLMTEEVAELHSFKGKSKKTAFLSYVELNDALLLGLQCNTKIKANATLEALHLAIPKTLKKAADRLRTRKRAANGPIIPTINPVDGEQAASSNSIA
ncbi:uncharacterized protein LOC110855417 isoform X2 [Folsomia candida]|uniref:uncharacterized protein LOC110855417 isoform X2 n=2 Tax=Folsomia candida TaxID=158441 RepID=UPI001604A793|nr:uncharacterized protein LOC110855417 isoform X2 [Folsomia candida]XP_035711838.1 uncharacterized protein LOC110855417 isoform X2 [Folsomia candida]